MRGMHTRCGTCVWLVIGTQRGGDSTPTRSSGAQRGELSPLGSGEVHRRTVSPLPRKHWGANEWAGGEQRDFHRGEGRRGEGKSQLWGIYTVLVSSVYFFNIPPLSAINRV